MWIKKLVILLSLFVRPTENKVNEIKWNEMTFFNPLSANPTKWSNTLKHTQIFLHDEKNKVKKLNILQTKRTFDSLSARVNII